MIDYNLFKSIIFDKNEGFIESGDFIDNELIKLFVSSPKMELVQSLFKKYDDNSFRRTYSVECECEVCGCLFVKEFTKTSLYDTIARLRGSNKRGRMIVCDKCQEKKKMIENEKHKAYEKEILANRMNETINYIQNYLNPNRNWGYKVKTWQKMQELTYRNVDWDKISSYIKDMNYYDFLKTPYWKAISEKVRYKAGDKCQICNGTDRLNVHHRTYDIHGDELHNMNDLICLCKNCHEKYHFD